MGNFIYAHKVSHTVSGKFTWSYTKEVFKEAIYVHDLLVERNKKIAYFFIDPLMHSFEAANEFYFNVFHCKHISKINTYRSGASPIQAIYDANEIIKSGLYDAVFIFGYEMLLTNKDQYGKEKVLEAMKLFDDVSLIECYNELGHLICDKLHISKETFHHYSDLLFQNYEKTYKKLNPTHSLERGRLLDDLGADLFRLTDCANPYIDFAGGVILASDEVCELVNLDKEKITVSGVSYTMVEASPHKLSKIVGEHDELFPHLKSVLTKAEEEANIQVNEELIKNNLLLEVYTCYPPIPLAFLLVGGFVKNIENLPYFLNNYEITITGGMSLARAPWNNPALNGMIEMANKLQETDATYGLVHGNGGIGELVVSKLL